MNFRKTIPVKETRLLWSKLKIALRENAKGFKELRQSLGILNSLV